ncbi:DUF2178 domain-containing protein [Pontibacillus halophilus]
MNEWFSDFQSAIYQPLRTWAEQSTGNWNILIGLGFSLVMGSVILTFTFYKMIGTEDERTSYILLKCSSFILLTIVLCDTLFPKDYMWTIFFLFKYGLAFLVGAMSMAIQYRRDMA